MGTRNLIVVQHGNEAKIAQYGRRNGYPEGQGITILSFLKKVNIDEFKQAVGECRFLTDDEYRSR